MVVNRFKQVLDLPVVATQEHDVVGISRVGHMHVDSELSPWVLSQVLTKNSVDNVNEEGRGECASLSNVGAKSNFHLP